MRDLLLDTRYALRRLRQMPGFVLGAVLALAFGIGVNTAVFSIANAVVIRPLPYPQPDRLVLLSERTPSGAPNSVSAANFLDWRAQSKSFSAMTAVAGGSMVTMTSGEAERIPVIRVSAGFFDVLSVKPALGRRFSSDEDRPGADPVVLLSHGAWQRRYGRDAALVGGKLILDGRGYTVIGVLPPGFQFMRPFEVVVPLALDAASAKRDYHYLMVLGRLKPGLALDRARAEMAGIAGNIARLYPEMKKGWSALVEDLHERLSRGPRTDMPILAGAAGFVLLIACANVAGLLLAKAAARRREMAVRVSLGAGRGRLLRQLLVESVLLALPGGAAGLVCAFWILRLVERSVPVQALPPGTTLSIDGVVLGFTLVLSVVTGILFGLFPALRASRPDLNEQLKQSSRGSAGPSTARLRSSLVAAELALSLVLTSGAGLLVRSLLLAQQTRAGFDAENVLTMRVELPPGRYASGGQARLFFQQSLDQFRALPGVLSAGFSTQLPMRGWAIGMPFEVVERPSVGASERPAAHFQMVSASYFRTMGIRLRSGRSLAETDTAASPRVAVVNETFARRFLGAQSPLGQHVRIQTLIPGQRELGPWVPWEVVGVAESLGLGDIQSRSPEIYVSFAQSPFPEGYISLRLAGNPQQFVEPARAAIRSLDKNVPVSDIRTMQQIRSESLAVPRVVTSLMGLFGILALLLAVIGVCGLMSWAVTERTLEIGVRTALGATPAGLLRMVMRQGITVVVVGLVLGLAGAVVLSRVLRRMLFGIAPHDPFTLLAASALLALAALAAVYFPARRVTRIDPVVALRQE